MLLSNGQTCLKFKAVLVKLVNSSSFCYLPNIYSNMMKAGMSNTLSLEWSSYILFIFAVSYLLSATSTPISPKSIKSINQAYCYLLSVLPELQIALKSWQHSLCCRQRKSQVHCWPLEKTSPQRPTQLSEGRPYKSYLLYIHMIWY